MNLKTYKRVRIVIVLFVSFIVSMAVMRDSFLLATAGVITGMLFLSMVRLKTKIRVDEREKTIREKAAQATYAIFAPVIGFGAFFLTLFGRGRFAYLEALGMVFSYLTLFFIALYAISYKYFSREFGGGGDGE